MRIQPRQQILDIWRSTARSSFQDGAWNWGGRGASNSISDAEQLLCLMAPATQVDAFRLHQPDQTAEDVVDSLRALGGRLEIPRMIVRGVAEYFQRYTDEDGTPIFSAEGYFASNEDGAEPTPEQFALEVVDSFSLSVTLSLATIGFLREFRVNVRRADVRAELNALEAMASTRLSAAMVGLLRSFTVYSFDANSPEGHELTRTVNQQGLPQRRVVEDLRRALVETIASLRDLTIGSGVSADLEDNNRLFECGWSWGIVKDAPTVETPEPVGKQPDGVAQNAPYLYFTVVALDAIPDLFSERTRVLGLLNEGQQRLARALQLRWDLTQRYWSTIASFGGQGTWPLEDIPWRTTDSVESDYFSLLVTSMVVQDLVVRRAPDAELSRVGQVLTNLARRGRIIQRSLSDSDPAVLLHAPGVPIALLGSEERGGPRLRWIVSDFAPQLLRRTVGIAGLLRDTTARDELLILADRTWDHIDARRLTSGLASHLWDQPANIFDQVQMLHEDPSWYYTARVVACLVAAARIVASPPLRSQLLTRHATDLLSEAEHLFDQELLAGSADSGPAMRQSLQRSRASLRRARELVDRHPGTAAELAGEVLRDLDRLVAARQDPSGQA